MKVISIGKSFRPAVLALTAMTCISGTALAKENNISDNKNITTEQTETGKKFPVKNLLLYTGIGMLAGAAGTIGYKAVRKKIEENKLSEFNYYDQKFLESGENINEYMMEVLENSIGNRPYFVDMDEFVNKTKDFVSRYPSKKTDLYLSIRPLSDLRLTDEQAEMLCRHLVLKATCTADEWKDMNIFDFLSDTDDYEKLVEEFIASSIAAYDEDSLQNPEEPDNQEALPSKEVIDKTLEKAKNANTNRKNVEHNLTFKDVGGQKEVIYELKKGILWPIKYPKAFENKSMKHGFVLYGAPGTGKTLIAETLANEADANFIKLNGNELSSKWVGQSEENWRNVFKYAIVNQPCIIFVDEFDSVAGKRGRGDIYGDKVLNHILGLLSDIEKNNDQVYFIATTNRLDIIDEAMIRSGRMCTYELKIPQNEEEVEQILDIHLKKQSVDNELDKKSLVKELFGIKVSGADIAYIVNEAYEHAMERMEIYEKMDKGDFQGFELDYLDITDQDFQKAIDEFKKSHSKPTSIGFRR